MLLNRIFKPFRSTTALGMDLGADGVRLVQLSRGREGDRLLWAEEVSLAELQGFSDFDVIVPMIQG